MTRGTPPDISSSQELDPKFQAFLDAAPDAIVVVDTTGHIVAINPLTEDMFAYSREQLLSSPIELLIPERYRTAHEQNRRSYADTPRTRPMGLGRDLRGRRSDGTEFPVQISLSPIETANGTLVISIIRDVTAQRRAEERFRGLLESAPDGIIVVDGSGEIVIVNSQTERMFGYAREELIGASIERLVPERFRETHIDDRSAYFADPRTRPMGAGRPLTGRKRDGSEFPVEISLSPLDTDQGMLVMSIVRDITDRRRAEELIQAQLREKEALLREIHHRVKNNLQVTSSLLRLQAGTIEDPATREVFASTQNRIRSMALVHEKLYQSTNLSRIDFAEYIRALGDLLFKSFGADPQSIRFRVEGNETFLSIDTAVPCGLVVNEILSNALKHAFPGAKRGEIVVSLHSSDNTCKMKIRDDGVGLRIDESRAGRTLGLQLVRGLVQQIDGTYDVHTNGGTEFTIQFPINRGVHG
jgi:PAS domain S-box-containing protein